jgi:hypothetical protein
MYHAGYDYDLLKHSGLGVASFILSIAVGVFDFLVVALAGLMEASSPGGMDEESVIAILIGLFILGALAANLAGMGLGIAGMVQRDRKKVFSVLGLAFNAAIVFGIIGLMVIGAAMP